MEPKEILIRGAREHNLKNITVSIPKNRLTVVSGLSGSGKSSLAFDTLYSEGQRRYVESLSAYARQFLGLMEKPDVDAIEGLSPAISIDQKAAVHNPRSTVGTTTEIHDYLRLLFARVGVPTCWNCGTVIARQTVQEITDSILALEPGTRFQLLAPVVSHRKGENRELLSGLQKDGFVRVRVDGTIYMIDEVPELDRNRNHSIDVVIDRLVAGKDIRGRLADSLETALKRSTNGTVHVGIVGGEELVFSERFACPDCGTSFDELSPRMFSFNSPFGACPECSGLGYLMEIDPELVVPDPSASLNDGAVVAWNGASTTGSWNRQILEAVCKHFRIPLDKPFKSLTAKQKKIIFHGSGSQKIAIRWETRSREGHGQFKREFEGVIPNLLRRYRETSSTDIRTWIEGFMTQRCCPACGGSRLRTESRSVLIDGKNIADLSAQPIGSVRKFFASLKPGKQQSAIAAPIVREVIHRLDFLLDVGLGYLTLARSSSTLSGGEAQRIRLATQIGSKLTGVTYILDEPSIGLHARDNARLLHTLESLRDIGNTVVVIEHDRETLLSADHLIDIGPGAGVHGGEVVAAGTPDEVMKVAKSPTGRYLSGAKKIDVPRRRRKGNGHSITLKSAAGHNLKNVDVSFPLGSLICVTGVSGSGKSSLVNETLYPALARSLYRSKVAVLPHKGVSGLSHIDKVINIDQSPIGRTPRSNPATYTKTLDPIRNLFAMLPESKIRGYTASRFSFNVKGGRCESCQGGGLIRIEMHFLPDVYVECEACNGRRYNRETLEVLYKGKNIAEVLDMTVDEALLFFENIPTIKPKLSVLSRVGLGYIHLGQQATTLSGGEAQRIKLAGELAKRSTGKTLYILDEPTTGLHFHDISMLLLVLQELVDRGNTVLIIEHNLDVVKCADWIIDLGPEGGDGGGQIIATGTPEQIARKKSSVTGQYLREYLA
jgi:excinuclease ABC subunit A